MNLNATGTDGNRRYSFFKTAREITKSHPRLTSIGEKAGDANSQYDACHNNEFINNGRNILSTKSSDHINNNEAESELKASRQVISLLQREIELIRVEKEGLEKLIAQSNTLKTFVSKSDKKSDNTDIDVKEDFLNRPETESVEDDSHNKSLLHVIKTQLYSKDEEIVKLRFNQKELQNEKVHLNIQLHSLEEDNKKLLIENASLKDMIKQRDQVKLSTSGESLDQMDSQADTKYQGRRMSYAAEAFNTVTSLTHKQKSARLQENLEASREKNELLSARIVDLTEKFLQAEKRESEASSQCLEWEAKCCQIQSKLLTLLKEIEQTSDSSPGNDASGGKMSGKGSDNVINSESVKTLIKRLLEDKSIDIPLSWKDGNKKKPKDNRLTKKFECDELGFYQSDASDNDELRMDSYAQQNSCDFNEDRVKGNPKSIDSMKNDEARWRCRWDIFIKNFDNTDLSRSKEFKSLLRTGVPQDYRCKVWKSIVDLKVGTEREAKGINYYQELLDSKPTSGSEKSINPASKQIELDLLRTLPNNRHFESVDSSGTVRLRRVLNAYAKRNPRVGYCQGMNRLAAVALLVLPEIEAFWCLVAIVEYIMPPNYYTDLWMAQIDSTVVMDFVAAKLPSLYEHFEHNQIDLSLFAWFLTIFVDGTPPSLYLRLWDSFLYEGDKILFRVAIALLKTTESELFKLKNSISVNNFLRMSLTKPLDMDNFFEVAFERTNPLSLKSLRYKRQYNSQVMRYGEQYERSSEEETNKTSISKTEDSSIMNV